MFVIKFEDGTFLNWQDESGITTTLVPETKQYSSREDAQARADEINAEADDDECCKVKEMG